MRVTSGTVASSAALASARVARARVTRALATCPAAICPVAICIVALGMVGSAVAQEAVSDAQVEGLLATVRAGQQAAPASPRPDHQPQADTTPVMDLGLDEAVTLALEQNPTIAAERLGPRIEELELARLHRAYRPTVSTAISHSNTVQLPRNQLTGGNRVEDAVQTYTFGANQELPWGGGSVDLSWDNRRQESTSAFNTFNPQYNATLSAVVTQPLLRDFRTDGTRTDIEHTRISRDVASLQLRATLTTIAASVRNAYWDLVYATEAVEVAEQSLALAETLVEENEARVEVGAMAPLDVVQAEAEAALRRQALAQATATERIADLGLKRLIVSGTGDPRWHARVNPVDRPSVNREPVDVAAALKNALGRRTDAAEARRGLEASDLNMRLFRNQSLPRADLVASYGLQGIGGTEIVRDSGLGGDVSETIPGSFGDALRRMTGRDFPAWNLQLQFSYPIGRSPAAASYERARVERDRLQMQMTALELQIATEVTNAAVQVESTLEQVDAARAARELAEQRLEAEEVRFEVGLSTAFFVVQAQRDLADAANVELRAILDHRRALVELERVQEAPAGGGGLLATSGTGRPGGLPGEAGLGASGPGTAGSGVGPAGGTGAAVNGTGGNGGAAGGNAPGGASPQP